MFESFVKVWIYYEFYVLFLYLKQFTICSDSICCLYFCRACVLCPKSETKWCQYLGFRMWINSFKWLSDREILRKLYRNCLWSKEYSEQYNNAIISLIFPHFKDKMYVFLQLIRGRSLGLHFVIFSTCRTFIEIYENVEEAFSMTNV